MSINKETKKRFHYQHDNNKKKKHKLALIILGSVVLLGGVACAIALPLTFCSKPTPTPPEPVEKLYTIKTDGTDEYFDINASNSLIGFIGGNMGVKDKNFYSKKYTELIISSGIDSIGFRAFRGCASFRDNTQPIKVDFNLQSSFTSIGEYAFDGCAGIIGVDFSKSADNAITDFIGEYAFAGCSLNSIIAGGTIQEVELSEMWGTGLHVFARAGFVPNFMGGSVDTQLNYTNCGCLAYGTFAPETDFSIFISINAFDGCMGITTVDFSKVQDEISNIGTDAFQGCALSNIIPGGGVSDITPGGWGDMHIFGLSYFVPNYTSTDTIPLHSSGCGCLAYGTFHPVGGDAIGDWVFSGCAGITAVDFSNFSLPNQSSSIGAYAFWDCMGIRSYTFADTQIYSAPFTIGSSAFSSCATTGKVISDSIDVANGLLALMIASSSSSTSTWMSTDFWIPATN